MNKSFSLPLNLMKINVKIMFCLLLAPPPCEAFASAFLYSPPRRGGKGKKDHERASVLFFPLGRRL